MSAWLLMFRLSVPSEGACTNADITCMQHYLDLPVSIRTQHTFFADWDNQSVEMSGDEPSSRMQKAVATVRFNNALSDWTLPNIPSASASAPSQALSQLPNQVHPVPHTAADNTQMDQAAWSWTESGMASMPCA